jgi:hypothetical protein
VLLFLSVLVLPHIVGPRVNLAHKVAFIISPGDFEPAELAPRLVVAAASGPTIELKDGIGGDTVVGERTYRFDVGKLVRHADDLKATLREKDLRSSLGGGSDGR